MVLVPADRSARSDNELQVLPCVAHGAAEHPPIDPFPVAVPDVAPPRWVARGLVVGPQQVPVVRADRELSGLERQVDVVPPFGTVARQAGPLSLVVIVPRARHRGDRLDVHHRGLELVEEGDETVEVRPPPVLTSEEIRVALHTGRLQHPYGLDDLLDGRAAFFVGEPGSGQRLNAEEEPFEAVLGQKADVVGMVADVVGASERAEPLGDATCVKASQNVRIPDGLDRKLSSTMKTCGSAMPASSSMTSSRSRSAYEPSWVQKVPQGASHPYDVFRLALRS